MIKNLRKNKKGFTLVEIIVVVVILAVLMAVAVPSVMKYVNEADNAKYMAQARGAMIVAQTESAKDYIKGDDVAARLTKQADGTYAWAANTSEDLDGLTTNPAVKNITAKLDSDGNVTEVTVTFDDATAVVTPNGSVVVTPKAN